MTLFKLVIRGQSKGRVECNWIPQITEIVSKWQSDSKQHLQKSCWFEHQHLYWVAEGQRDGKSSMGTGPPLLLIKLRSL